MDSSFSTIFHFCYMSLLIFKFLMLIFDNLNIPQTVACQHGVLAIDLINSSGQVGLASRRRPSLLSHVSSAVQNLDSALLRMLLWPPKKSTLESAPSLFGSMGGSFLSHVLANIHIFELRHLSSTIVIIKILQKIECNYKHSWSC